MSLLLDLQYGAVLEGPLNHVGVRAGSLDEIARLEIAPEVAEVFKFDLVPYIGKLGLDDSRLGDGRRGWDGGHADGLELSSLVLFLKL